METFGSSRAGARNIAGVHYQAVVTSRLLLGEADLSVESVRPEGDEDCDVFVASEAESRSDPLRVQMKFRSQGLSESELAMACIKAWGSATQTAVDVRRIAVCTNLEPGFIPVSGWRRSIGATLLESPGHRAKLVAALQTAARAQGVDVDPEIILARSHLVQISSGFDDLVRAVSEQHHFGTQLHAQLAAAQVLERVLRVAAENRHANRETATVLTRHLLTEILTDVADATGSWIHTIEARRLVTVPAFARHPSESRSAFLRGVRARPQHIGAGYPVLRPRWLGQLQELIEAGSSALLVGPSGSGKSTLMWQAAYSSQQTKVFVLEQASSSDVTELASFFRLMAPSSGSPVLICAEDVNRPELAGWAGLLRELASDAQVRLIGTCREDAFDPAFTATGSAAIVRPRLDPDEALEVGLALFDGEAPSSAELKTLYGESGGLLLEFVHLATTSSHLADVLSEQAASLLRGDPAVAAVARLAVTADICEVKLQADQLRILGYPDPALSAALTLLDAEHVVVQDSGVLRGMHPQRSRHLMTELHHGLPRIAETLALLTRIAPAAQLRTLMESWIRLTTDDVVLLEKSLAARIENDQSLSAREITDLLYRCEAGIYARTVEGLLSPADAELKEAVLLGGMAGRAQGMSLLTTGVWEAPLGGQHMSRSLPLMERFDRLHESIPRPRTVRRNVIMQLDQARSRLIDELPTDLIALQNLVASEAFEPAEVDRIISGCVGSWDAPYPRKGFLYPPAAPAALILGKNRLMASKTVAAAARLSSAGAESAGRVLGIDRGARVRWVLDRAAFVVDTRSVAQDWPTVKLLTPGLDVATHDFEMHFSALLSDAAVVAGLESLEAVLVGPDGAAFQHETGRRLSGSAPGGLPSRVLGMVLQEDAQLVVGDSWFDWLRRTESAIHAAVEICELAVSVCLEALKRPPSPQTLRRLSEQFRKAENALAVPLGFPPTQHPDVPDTLSAEESPYSLSPQDAAKLLGKTLGQVVSICSYAANWVVGQEHDEVPDMIDASVVLTWDLLREAGTFMENFRGTTSHNELARLTEAFSAVQAVACCLATDDTASRSVLKGVAPSRTDPSRSVQLVLSALDRKYRASSAYERDGLSTGLGGLPGRWTLAEIQPLGGVHRLPLPCWALISPPMNNYALQDLDDLCSQISGVEDRICAVLTGVDGEWDEKVLVFRRPGEWHPLAQVKSDSVKHQLYRAGHAPTMSPSLRPPEASHLDVLLPELSFRIAQARLTRRPVVGLEEWRRDLSGLLAAIPEPARGKYARVVQAVIAEAHRDDPAGLAEQSHRYRVEKVIGPLLSEFLGASSATARSKHDAG